MTKQMILVHVVVLLVMNGCQKTNPEKGSTGEFEPGGKSSSQTNVHPPSKIPFHVLQTPGHRYAWSGDFDKDGTIDSLLFGIPEIPDFCNRIAICLDPLDHDSSDKKADNEPGLLTTLANGSSFFLWKFIHFPNPETSNMELETAIEDRIRIIHPGERDYLEWKTFAPIEGDIIGIMENAGIEIILYFKNGTFQEGYSDDEP